MNHLEKIVFIQSAGINYGEFDLNGNVHFSGGNGTGKSLLINGISLLILGKSGVSHSLMNPLFPTQDSMITGQWQNAGRKFTVCAFISPSGKLRFLFVSGEYESEIFSQDYIPRTHAEILNQIQKRKLDHLITDPDTDDYLSILWGFAPSADQPLVKKFSIGKNFPPRLYHAYIPGHSRKPDFEWSFIRALHRFTLAETLPDLPAIRDMLQRFSSAFADIHTYEYEKSRIAKILSHAKEIADYESRIKELFSALNGQYHHVLLKKNEAEKQHTNYLRQREVSVQQLELLTQTHQQTFTKLQLFRDKTFAELQLAREKFSFYHNHSQSHLLSELPFLPAKKRELNNSIREWENITGKSPSPQINMDALALEEKQFLQDLDLQKRDLQQTSLNAILDFSTQKIRQKESLIQHYRTKILILDQQISECHQKMISIHDRISEMKSQGKKSSKGNSLHLEIRKLEEKQLQLTGEAEAIKGNLEMLRLKKVYEIEAEEKLLQQNLLHTENGGSDLRTQLKTIESQIKNRQGTLYQWLEKNYPDWRKTFGKVMKEEVLFHPFLSPEIERLNDLVFGVKMDLSDLNFELKSVKDLEKEKSIVEKAIENQEKETLTLRSDSEKRLIAIEKKYQQKFRQAEKDQKKNQYEWDLNSSRLRQLRQQQDGFIHEADRDTEAMSIHLLYEVEEIKKQIRQLENEKAEAHSQWDTAFSDIEKEAEIHHKDCQSALSQSMKTLETLEQETLQSFTVRRKALKSETKPSKADTKSVKDLKNQIAELETKIEQLEMAESLFWRYRMDNLDYLTRIPLLEDQLKTADLKILDFSALAEKETRQKNEELARLQNAISEIESTIREAEDQIRAFENFRQSPVYQSEYRESDKEEMSEEKIPVIIRRIVEADYARDREEESLKREIHTFTTCFSRENIAGFPNQFDELSDYYRFVKQIQHFQESDQIDILRDQVGSKFARLIHQLAEIAGSWEKRYKSLEESINSLNRILSTLPQVAVMPKITLAISPGRHPLMGVFAKISAFSIQHSHQLGELSLFNQSENAVANREAIHLLESLNQLLRDYPRNEIADCDFAEISIQSLNNPGQIFSPGQNYYVQQVLRIALLSMAVRLTAESDNRFHLMIDQAEMFDEESIFSLSAFARQEGINLITAAPEVPGGVSYQQVYLLGLSQPLTMFFSLNSNKAFSNGPRL